MLDPVFSIMLLCAVFNCATVTLCRINGEMLMKINQRWLNEKSSNESKTLH